MTVYRRGSTWWYKFLFKGQLVRESAKSESKTLAKEAEKQRRRELEQAFNRIPEKKSVPLFSTAARDWLTTKETKAPKTLLGYQQRMKPVIAVFGKRLVCDIGADDVLAYWAKRKRDGVSNRTINYEMSCLRGVLRIHKMWLGIAQEFAARELKVKLKENHDIGKALSVEDENYILAACRQSTAPSLLPLFVFARDTGLRAAEIKELRRRDLKLAWTNGVIEGGEVVVPKSKTEAGKGRSVPFSPDVCSTLTIWLSRFAGAKPDSFVFPRHGVQMLKGARETKIENVMLTKPVQSWQRAWRTALRSASLGKLADFLRAEGLTESQVHERVAAVGGISDIPSECRIWYRWHDLRHTFISRLAENPTVSEETIKALAGHVSKQMLERYSHIRTHAKRQAIAALYASRNELFSGVGTKLGTASVGTRQEGNVTN